MRATLWMAMLLVLGFSACAEQAAVNPEVETIKAVVEESYVGGIQVDRDVEAVWKGFDPTFNLLIMRDDAIYPRSIGAWIEMIEGLSGVTQCRQVRGRSSLLLNSVFPA